MWAAETVIQSQCCRFALGPAHLVVPSSSSACKLNIGRASRRNCARDIEFHSVFGPRSFLCYLRPPRWNVQFRSVLHLQSESPIENTYPRPRDRRFSRKTRAAVGKSPGSANAVPGVSSADSPGAISLPSRHRENTSTPLLLQSTRSWRSIGPVQFPTG